MSEKHTHKVTIRPYRTGPRGTLYSVEYEGQVITPSAHQPTATACRYLAGRNLSGAVEVWGANEGFPRLRIADLQKAALVTVRENEKHGPRFVPYKPLDVDRFSPFED